MHAELAPKGRGRSGCRSYLSSQCQRLVATGPMMVVVSKLVTTLKFEVVLPSCATAVFIDVGSAEVPRTN